MRREGVRQEGKHTTSIVLHKKKGPTGLGNYRGTSLVAYAGKVLLKAAANRLTSNCEWQDMLQEQQCGLRQKNAIHNERSTVGC